MAKEVRTKANAHAMHRRKYRMGFKRVINNKEIRNRKTGTRRHALERRKAAETDSQLEPKVKSELDATTTARQPVQRIFPNAFATVGILVKVQIPRFAMEKPSTLPVEIELAIEVFHRQAITQGQVEFRCGILKFARFPRCRRRGPALQKAGYIKIVHDLVTCTGIATEAPAGLVHIAVNHMERKAQVQAV